jgi:membrane-associated phospholipid phosphatase
MNDEIDVSIAAREPADGPGRPAPALGTSLSATEWCRRLIPWAIVAAALAGSIRYDRYLTAWGRDYVGWLPGHVVVSFRDFGQITPVIAVTIALAYYDRRRGPLIAAMIVAASLAGALQGIGKLVIHRYRPYADELLAFSLDDWRALWVGVSWHKEPTRLQAFPSGHTCLAFAFAGVLSGFYPRARWVFWTLAVGCGFARYIEKMHWISDCIAGGILGYLSAWLALRPLRKPGGPLGGS